MPSSKSKPSRAKNEPLACDLNLPDWDEPQVERWPMKMSWEDAMRNFAPMRDYYMRHFDSPEKRLREKHPEPFRLL